MHHTGCKGLWSYIDGSEQEPKFCFMMMVDGKVEEIKGVVRDKLIKEFQKKKKGWRINHHKAMSWLLNNVGSMVSAQLAKFGLAHEAWEYLKETHMMKDVAHKWNVQLKISKLQQGDKYIKY